MFDYSQFLGDLDIYRDAAGSWEQLPTPSAQESKPASQDLLLFANPARRFTVLDRVKFINYYNCQSEAARAQIKVLRPYWLGLPGPLAQPRFRDPTEVEAFIRERLLDDIVNMVADYGRNRDRTPPAHRRRAERSDKGHRPRLYRDWFDDHFGASTYTHALVSSLADFASPLGIPETAELWGLSGPVLTAEESEELALRVAELNYDECEAPEAEKLAQLEAELMRLKQQRELSS